MNMDKIVPSLQAGGFKIPEWAMWIILGSLCILAVLMVVLLVLKIAQSFKTLSNDSEKTPKVKKEKSEKKRAKGSQEDATPKTSPSIIEQPKPVSEPAKSAPAIFPCGI